MKSGILAIAATVAAIAAAASPPALGQAAPNVLAPLTVTTTPLPPLAGIVRDVAAARRLGKALFWDMNTGSDGMACASCHHAAGADTRIENTLSPGLTDQRWARGDAAFGALTAGSVPGMTAVAAFVTQAWPGDFSPARTAGKTAGGATAGPGYTLRATDFPTHQLKNMADRNSAIVYTTNDAVSSQGVIPSTFISLSPTDPAGETCTPQYDSPFLQVTRTGSVLLRAVEPRNSPTTINAGFQKRNFWDGRANNTFNGFDPFGNRSPSAMLVDYNAKNGTVTSRRLALPNGNLASQAVGPPLSHIEMSCGGKTFPMLGRKLLPLPALQKQAIHPNDSVLGAIAASRPTYQRMIQDAFDPRWWSAPATVKLSRTKAGTLAPDLTGFTQMELNFPMFFGVAVMLYEATLVSGQTPLDRTLGGAGPRTLTADEQAGMALFTGKGQCVACHSGPVLSNGTLAAAIEFMPTPDPGASHYDIGFYNVGANYTVTDLGLGGTDPWGNPLSYVRQLLTGKRFDTFTVNYCATELTPYPQGNNCDPAKQLAAVVANAAAQRVSIDGAFQTPTLRNIGLTPPYFHNGSAKNLMEVVDFYNRGGNARGPLGNDTTGTGRLGRPLGRGDPVAAYRTGSNLSPDITVLALTDVEKRQLVAFMLALTDDRVSCDKAPFDHPELRIPAADGTGSQYVLPAVGAAGLAGANAACRPNSGELFKEYGHLSLFRF